MQEFFQETFKIIDLLEQIKTLTNNQTTVLLIETNIEEDIRLDLVEEMANYKDELINTLREQEVAFEKMYTKHRKNLEKSGDIVQIKELIGRILELQEEIVQVEKNNVMLIQNQYKKYRKKIVLPVNTSKAVNAYQKQKR